MLKASPLEIGTQRRAKALELLAQYSYVSGDQLTRAVWRGQDRLARRRLLQGTQEGVWRRLPHPIDRRGSYIYTTGARRTSHSQQVLHCLAKVELHVDMTARGASVRPELPWGTGCVPDQTVIWRGVAWAVEHHLSGQFEHMPDYRRCFTEAAYEEAPWWQEGLRPALLIIPASDLVSHVRRVVKATSLPGVPVNVVELADVTRNPGLWLQVDGGVGR